MLTVKILNPFILCAVLLVNVIAQEVPSSFENIESLMTFSKDAPKQWGDDDNVQTYFFSIPKSSKGNVYIRVFDPNCDGALDQANGSFDSKTKFSIYGGKDAFSHPSATNVDPIRGYDSGTLLDSKTFGDEKAFDEKWYSFGPFNPKEGELRKGIFPDSEDEYVFKVLIEGMSGNDGNAYKLQLSANPDKLEQVDGALAFAYEISFRLKKDVNDVAHFYPFIEKNVVSVKQNNFDFDGNGEIRITSVTKNMHRAETSRDGNWISSVHDIVDEELNTSLDMQIVKNKESENDMVVYLQNQYGDAIPFYAIPQPNVPKYKYKVKVKIE